MLSRSRVRISLALLRFPSRIGVWDLAEKRTPSTTSCFGGLRASPTIMMMKLLIGLIKTTPKSSFDFSAAQCELLFAPKALITGGFFF